MKSTITHITLSGILLLMLLFSAPLGQVLNGHAQSNAEWSDPINLSNSGASTNPSMVVDNKGVIHVIWLDAVDGYKYVKSTDGIKWSVPVTVDFPFNPVGKSPPKLVADSFGTIHILWTDEEGALMYGRADSIFLSQPRSWSSVFKLAKSTLDFDMVVDARSSIHVTYAGNLTIDNEPAGVFYRRLDGTVWTPPVRLYSSQYFRTQSLENSHVRLAVVGAARSGTAYVVWDDRSAKRIFMARSLDGGLNWEETVQLRGPEDSLALAFPYNVNISGTGNKVLLTWQVGQPGALCSQYSQWSEDRAENFSEPLRLSDDGIICPSSGMFLGDSQKYFLMMLDLFGDFSLVAWNGSEWSLLKPQNELSTFPNPLTLDDVVLGCQQATYRADTIYVVGCDQTGTGDIWFMFRRLGSFVDWFPPPSSWAGPVPVSSFNQEISSSTVVADNSGGLHSMWIQYDSSSANLNTATVQYAKWDTEKWSRPANIITDITGVPHYLNAIPDMNGGLLLAWVQGEYGNIYFNRGNGDKAYLTAEWTPALRIPSLSELNTTPDMVVDSADRLVLVYSIPINEYRGIYLVQSNDLGRNWSEPVRVIDAVAENWDSVIQPKIELSEDGRLHLLVTRNSLRQGDKPSSLYYLQSIDGGATWTTPEAVSEQSVQWSEITHVGVDVLYRLWQERNEDFFETYSELSSDGGLTWSAPLKISSVEGSPAELSLSSDVDGQLYLLQSHVEGDSLVVEEIHWDGTRWNIDDAKVVSLIQETDPYFIASGIASDRTLHFLIAIDYTGLSATINNEILGYSRFLDPLNKPDNPSSSFIPALAKSIATPVPTLIPTPQSSLEDIEEVSNARMRNIVGLALVAGTVILTLLIIRPSIQRKRNK